SNPLASLERIVQLLQRGFITSQIFDARLIVFSFCGFLWYRCFGTGYRSSLLLSGGCRCLYGWLGSGSFRQNTEFPCDDFSHALGSGVGVENRMLGVPRVFHFLEPRGDRFAENGFAVCGIGKLLDCTRLGFLPRALLLGNFRLALALDRILHPLKFEFLLGELRSLLREFDRRGAHGFGGQNLLLVRWIDL